MDNPKMRRGGRPGRRQPGEGSYGQGPGPERRARFIKRARESVMEAMRSRDMLLASVTRSMEDLDKTINLLAERFEDWYGIHFPELKTEEKLQYCDAALIIDRDNVDVKGLATILGQKKAEELAASSATSLGVKLPQKDLSQCLSLARTILSMDRLRKDYEAYQKELAQELCPNLAAVGGPDIAARLVSHVGSLTKLAFLPASAIQVLGAEKALFKHLRNRRIPPPKHGIIFQHPKISSSPKSVRGKIARTLANKLCLAAKADAFSKRDLSATLVKGFNDRYAEIMKEYERGKAKGAQPANPSA